MAGGGTQWWDDMDDQKGRLGGLREGLLTKLPVQPVSEGKGMLLTAFTKE